MPYNTQTNTTLTFNQIDMTKTNNLITLDKHDLLVCKTMKAIEELTPTDFNLTAMEIKYARTICYHDGNNVITLKPKY